MDPINQETRSAMPSSQVWPPPPTQLLPGAEPSSISPMESFQIQSYWLVLFLTIITLGIYGIFWLKRQIAVVNRQRPDLKLSQGIANMVLILTIASLCLGFAAGATHSSSLDTASQFVGRIVGLMVLFLLFHVRNGINMMQNARRGGPYWFSGVFTWLFGTAYLQYKINRNIQLWRSQPRD